MLEKLPDALGEALSDVRAGLTQTVYHAVDLRQGMGSLQLASVAFADHTELPQNYTADGAGLSPPLHWAGVPAGTQELVLIVEDADSPTPQPLVHAIVHGLPAEDMAGALAEGAFSVNDASPPTAGGLAPASEPTVAMGRNSLLMARWLPPDPPPGHGAHRYVFQLYALAPGPGLPATPGRDAVVQALQQRGVASGCLTGTYERRTHALETQKQLSTHAPQTTGSVAASGLATGTAPTLA